MLAAESLAKRYEDGELALADFTFTVPDGAIVALLGGNGAGKSTTMRCFLDFTRPTAGRALVDGIDVAREPLRAKARLAWIPELVAVYDALTGRQNLRWFAALGGRALRREEAGQRLVAAGIPASAVDRPVRGWSKGMRQKLGIAIAVAREARNLLLDEPTSGLDPLAAAELGHTLARLRDEGAAILVATHDLFRARALADHVLVLRAGRCVASWPRAHFAGADVERLYAEALAAPAPPTPAPRREPVAPA